MGETARESMQHQVSAGNCDEADITSHRGGGRYASTCARSAFSGAARGEPREGATSRAGSVTTTRRQVSRQ